MTGPDRVYHRRGEPGGPGCEVGVLEIVIKGADGQARSAELLDAGIRATEVELLRTVAAGFGVQWGHDDLGWWAVRPAPARAGKPWWQFW